MGRLILLILIIAAIVLVWKAFGPGTWNKNRQQLEAQRRQEIKGPDDDENFLWELEKNRFKKRRAQEEAERQERERITRAQRKYGQPQQQPEKPEKPKDVDGGDNQNPPTPPADPKPE